MGEPNQTASVGAIYAPLARPPLQAQPSLVTAVAS